jgi:8-oxo-dGTP pyrophosphatase MutT (NUDIX family)
MPDADQQRADRRRAVPSAELVDRARAYRDLGGSPAVPKASATVILLRDQPDDAPDATASTQLEVFMIRRHTGMLFAGGMYVFPGGVVDAADEVNRDHEQAHAFAAIRETFEECGVLLASGPELDAPTLDADRLAMIEHRATFDEVLTRHRSTARPDLLRAWSRWITPEFEPRRYDTHFYVALAPAREDARFVGGEADAAQWVTPARALAAQERGEWLLMPPTEWTLRELTTFTSAADVFAAANRRDLTPVQVRIDLDSEPPRWVVIE